MGSKSLLSMLWLIGTVVAATVAWQSLGFVSATTEGQQAGTAGLGSDLDRTTTTGADANQATGASSVDTTLPASPTGPGADSSAPQPTASTIPTLVEQTFDLVGGRTAISFSPTKTFVLWATPATGYTVESDTDDGGIEVKFTNGVHESKIEAWWADGARFEVRERDD